MKKKTLAILALLMSSSVMAGCKTIELNATQFLNFSQYVFYWYACADMKDADDSDYFVSVGYKSFDQFGQFRTSDLVELSSRVRVYTSYYRYEEYAVVEAEIVTKEDSAGVHLDATLKAEDGNSYIVHIVETHHPAPIRTVKLNLIPSQCSLTVQPMTICFSGETTDGSRININYWSEDTIGDYEDMIIEYYTNVTYQKDEEEVTARYWSGKVTTTLEEGNYHVKALLCMLDSVQYDIDMYVSRSTTDIVLQEESKKSIPRKVIKNGRLFIETRKGDYSMSGARLMN